MLKVLPLLICFFLLANQSNAQDQDKNRILIFGDSITAGYGLDPSEAFPALLQQKIDSAGYHYEVINGGLSGETTAGGVRRIDWILQRPVDIMVLELGGNDALRGIDLTSTKKNLERIIEKARSKYPEMEIILAGMEAPPNLGNDYTSQFRELYSEIAAEYDLPFIPFILKDVGGVPELNQPDGIHPTARGHEIIAETVWETLEPIIKERS